jgi:hypothetical protein
MSTFIRRTCFLALAILVTAVGSNAQANGHGGGWGHHHHGGHTHWSVGVGVGFGYWPYAPWGYWPGYYPYPYGWAPGYPMAEQPMVVDAPPSSPPPAYTPRQGQSAEEVELDQRLCDREAMASPAAMADASIFHRIVLVCMENRGYTVH